ncbi:MAG: hypothetical protein QTN59_16095 [Candidatus Electrothrix communis]|nr:hypothetical protein [Desulfobulbus sp. US4]WLE96193.1 MAG: hypothetical protein QTN59_16095 [Candidatus Electrothrix communis]
MHDSQHDTTTALFKIGDNIRKSAETTSSPVPATCPGLPIPGCSTSSYTDS